MTRMSNARSKVPLLMSLALVTAATTAAPPARADDAHYQNVLVGERALGLGGAFTGLASDSSATYYNPAGLVRIDSSSFTLQSSVYGFLREELDGALSIGGVRKDVATNSFNVIPTTLAIVKDLSRGRANGSLRQKIAFSVYLVDRIHTTRRTELENVTVSVGGWNGPVDSFTELEQDQDATMLVGASYAIAIARRVSIGTTVYLAYRSLSRHLNSTAVANGGASFGRVVASVEGTHLSLLGALGVLARPWRGLALGLTLYSPNLRVYDGARVGVEQAQTQPASITSENREDVEFSWPQPMRVTLGAAYEIPKKLAVAADVSLHLPGAAYRDIDDPVIGLDHAINLTLNFNVGLEYYPLSILPLRVGFFSNFSRDDDFDVQTNGQAGFDMFGLSASVGVELKQTSFTLGTLYSFGSGPVQTHDAGGRAEGSVARQVLLVMVSGSYNF